LRCSHCGSAVHRNSRYRKLKNGKKQFHVYYLCTKTNDKSCIAKHVSEEQVYRNIAESLNSIDLRDIDFPEDIKQEITKFECMKWNIHSQMSENPMRLRLHLLKFSEVDQETIKMYLQNEIFFGSIYKRYTIIEILVIRNNFVLIKL